MSSVPFSNPAGNNQTNPVSSLMPKVSGGPTMPGAKVGAISNNPYVPAGAGGTFNQVPGSSPGPSVPNAGGLIPGGPGQTGTTGALSKQLTDIYGKGVGGALNDLLAGMSGTDSAILQQYIASMQPQMAKAQANTNAALGAGGVSANSSVAAIADSNLQAQETSAIAGESAKLTMSQEELTAQILTGMQGAASKEVATSGWSIFGDVMNQITGDVGNLLGGSYKTAGNTLSPTTPGPAMSAAQLPFGGVAPVSDPSLGQPGLDMSIFA